MVASGAALQHGSATEFAGPQHKGGIEQSALIQILQQGSDRLIGLGGIALVVVGVVVVAIPAQFIDSIIDLDEANPFFDESAGQQAHAAVGGKTGVGAVQAIGIQCVGRFLSQLTDIDGFGLHPPCQFVGGDATFQLFVCGVLSGVSLVECASEVQSGLLGRQVGVGRAQVEHRIALVAELCALKGGRQKCIAPVG